MECLLHVSGLVRGESVSPGSIRKTGPLRDSLRDVIADSSPCRGSEPGACRIIEGRTTTPKYRSRVAVQNHPIRMPIQMLDAGHVGNAVEQDEIRTAEFELSIRIHRPGVFAATASGQI